MNTGQIQAKIGEGRTMSVSGVKSTVKPPSALGIARRIYNYIRTQWRAEVDPDLTIW